MRKSQTERSKDGERKRDRDGVIEDGAHGDDGRREGSLALRAALRDAESDVHARKGEREQQKARFR